MNNFLKIAYDLLKKEQKKVIYFTPDIIIKHIKYKSIIGNPPYNGIIFRPSNK